MTEQYAGTPGRPASGMTVIPGGEGTPIPECPNTVKSPERWSRLWATGRSWLSNDAHYDLMRMVCEALEDRDRLRAALHNNKNGGTMVVGSMGQRIVNPLYKQLDAAETKCARLLDQAGFSPAKQKVKVASKDRVSKLDEMRAAAAAGKR